MAHSAPVLELDERLCIASASLLSLLEDVSTTAGTLRSELRGRYPSLNELSDQCHALYKSVSELELILNLYVTHLTDGQADSFPVDPSLEDWLQLCTTTVAQIQDALAPQQSDEHLSEHSHRSDQISQNALLYHRLAEAAEGHVDHLQAFMPILKADLDDFLAAQIAQTETDFSSADGGARVHAPTYTQGIPLIRHTLYDLRDALKTLQKRLAKLDGDAFPTAAVLHSTGKTLIAQLDEILTNHASEWLESTLAGKMTFAEFSRLNVFDLRMCMGEVTKLNRKSSREVLDDELADFLTGTLDELTVMFKVKIPPDEARVETVVGSPDDRVIDSAVLVTRDQDRQEERDGEADIDSEAVESADDTNDEWEVVSVDDLTGEGNVIVGLGRESVLNGVPLPLR